MPRTNDPAHRHSTRAPRTLRKSKPKFEIPVEAGLPEAPVGWVSRAESTTRPTAATEEPEQHDSEMNPFVTAGMELFFIGARTIGFMSLAAFGLIAVPVRAAKRMLNSD